MAAETPTDDTSPPMNSSKLDSFGGHKGRTLLAGLMVLLLAVALSVVVKALTSEDAEPAGTLTTAAPQTGGQVNLCAPGSWPIMYDGMPSIIDDPQVAGFFVWRGADGWSIRVRGTAAYRVVVTASNAIEPKDVRALSGSPAATVTGRTITFEGRSEGELIGFDLGACFYSSLQFEMTENGQVAPASATSIGAQSRALENPFTATRGN